MYLLREDLMQLKTMLQQLAAVHGRHTDCVSLYLPKARAISETVNYLKNEINESSSIKDKANRLSVTENLLRLID